MDFTLLSMNLRAGMRRNGPPATLTDGLTRLEQFLINAADTAVTECRTDKVAAFRTAALAVAGFRDAWDEDFKLYIADLANDIDDDDEPDPVPVPPDDDWDSLTPEQQAELLS